MKKSALKKIRVISLAKNNCYIAIKYVIAIWVYKEFNFRNLLVTVFCECGRADAPRFLQTALLTASSLSRLYDSYPFLDDALMKVRKEIAILKKLDSPRVVKLFEVLDNPEQGELILLCTFPRLRCPFLLVSSITSSKKENNAFLFFHLLISILKLKKTTLTFLFLLSCLLSFSSVA
jgi:hypothetical protein